MTSLGKSTEIHHNSGVLAFCANYVRAATLQKCGSEIFSVFLCQRCREIFGEIFRVTFSRTSKNGVKNGKFHTNFTLLWRSAEMCRRCPTYQLHLPPKTRFGDPKSPLHENARKIGKFRASSIKDYFAMPRKTPIQGIPGSSFWGSRTGILG